MIVLIYHWQAYPQEISQCLVWVWRWHANSSSCSIQIKCDGRSGGFSDRTVLAYQREVRHGWPLLSDVSKPAVSWSNSRKDWNEFLHDDQGRLKANDILIDSRKRYQAPLLWRIPPTVTGECWWRRHENRSAFAQMRSTALAETLKALKHGPRAGP